VRGLQRMVAEGRDCEAILTQLMAPGLPWTRGPDGCRPLCEQMCIVDAEGDLSRERVRRILDLVLSRFSLTSAGKATMRMIPTNQRRNRTMAKTVRGKRCQLESSGFAGRDSTVVDFWAVGVVPADDRPHHRRHSQRVRGQAAGAKMDVDHNANRP